MEGEERREDSSNVGSSVRLDDKSFRYCNMDQKGFLPVEFIDLVLQMRASAIANRTYVPNGADYSAAYKKYKFMSK